MIIYFEGLCGVGKSTLINNYSKKNTHKIPQFIKNPDELFDDYACMQNDELKSKQAKENKDKVVLVDRGYLSTLVYGLVRYKVSNKVERFDHIAEWLLSNLDSTLVRPDIYIWIDAPNEVCMKRVIADSRLLPDSYWYKDIDAARFWYRKLFNTLEKEVPLYMLDGKLSITENINKLSEIIDENTTNKR